MATAFLFPGQGSQKVGMLKELAAEFDVVKGTFAEASDATGTNLWSLASRGPAQTLNRTRYTQPVMLAADIAVWRCWQESGGTAPDFLAGHSLGEFAALVAAGSINFADGVTLVQKRAALMEDATPEGSGAMAAILGLDDALVEEACRGVARGQVVQAANYNAPEQTVISGEADAVDRAIEQCKRLGAKKAVLLPVSAPSHCALMRPAAARLHEYLASVTIEEPTIPVIQNVDARAHAAPTAIRDALVRQLYGPVRWTQSMRHLIDEQGVDQVFECGPGKVLCGLQRRIDRDVSCEVLEAPDSLREHARE